MENEDQPKIAYLGIRGSYSYQACAEYFPGAAYKGYGKFEEAFTAVESGAADYAMIPIENSTAGRVAEVYNCLPTTTLKIVGEHLLPIHHCLMVPLKAFRSTVPPRIREEDILAWKTSGLTEDEKKAALASIREVQSHAQALMQCSSFLAKMLPNAKTTAVLDTATAARGLSQNQHCEIAAVGSGYAADTYSMAVLAENIEDDAANMTRFLVFAREPLKEKIDGPALTSILFATSHKPGSLYGVLKAFADEGITLTKLETYMLNQKRPKPTFYVDVGASQDSAQMKTAFERFKANCEDYAILGSYPASAERGKQNGFLPVSVLPFHDRA